jgi:diphthamide biosynthesis protein 7
MTAFDTMYPADAVEFCPHPNALDIFACGTYKLDDPASQPFLGEPASEQTIGISSVLQKRRGQCLLFQVDSTFDRGL